MRRELERTPLGELDGVADAASARSHAHGSSTAKVADTKAGGVDAVESLGSA